MPALPKAILKPRLLIGEGPERPQAEALIDRLGIRSRVIMVGAVPHERIPELIAAMIVKREPHVPLEPFSLARHA